MVGSEDGAEAPVSTRMSPLASAVCRPPNTVASHSSVLASVRPVGWAQPGGSSWSPRPVAVRQRQGLGLVPEGSMGLVPKLASGCSMCPRLGDVAAQDTEGPGCSHHLLPLLPPPTACGHAPPTRNRTSAHFSQQPPLSPLHLPPGPGASFLQGPSLQGGPRDPRCMQALQVR